MPQAVVAFLTLFVEDQLKWRALDLHEVAGSITPYNFKDDSPEVSAEFVTKSSKCPKQENNCWRCVTFIYWSGSSPLHFEYQSLDTNSLAGYVVSASTRTRCQDCCDTE